MKNCGRSVTFALPFWGIVRRIRARYPPSPDSASRLGHVPQNRKFDSGASRHRIPPLRCGHRGEIAPPTRFTRSKVDRHSAVAIQTPYCFLRSLCAQIARFTRPVEWDSLDATRDFARRYGDYPRNRAAALLTDRGGAFFRFLQKLGLFQTPSPVRIGLLPRHVYDGANPKALFRAGPGRLRRALRAINWRELRRWRLTDCRKYFPQRKSGGNDSDAHDGRILRRTD